MPCSSKIFQKASPPQAKKMKSPFKVGEATLAWKYEINSFNLNIRLSPLARPLYLINGDLGLHAIFLPNDLLRYPMKISKPIGFVFFLVVYLGIDGTSALASSEAQMTTVALETRERNLAETIADAKAKGYIEEITSILNEQGDKEVLWIIPTKLKAIVLARIKAHFTGEGFKVSDHRDNECRGGCDYACHCSRPVTHLLFE